MNPMQRQVKQILVLGHLGTILAVIGGTARKIDFIPTEEVKVGVLRSTGSDSSDLKSREI